MLFLLMVLESNLGIKLKQKPLSNRSAKDRRNTMFRVLDGVLDLSTETRAKHVNSVVDVDSGVPDQTILRPNIIVFVILIANKEECFFAHNYLLIFFLLSFFRLLSLWK